MITGLLLALSFSDSLPVHDVRVGPGELLRVTAVGSGPTVVFLPNLFGSAYGFRRLLSPLSHAGYGAVVVEPLGTGFSSYPKHADYSLTAQSDRVGRVLAHERIRAAVMVGHGVGVSIALRLAYRHPEQVAGVVGIDGGALDSAATPGIRQATASGPLLRLFMSSAGLRRRVRRYLIQNSSDTSWVTAEVVAHYSAGPERNLGAMIDAWQGMVAAREPERLRDHLALIHQPVRLLVGSVAHRSGIQPAEITELRDALSDFAVDNVPGAGGLIHEEQPVAVLSVIRSLAPSPSSGRAMHHAIR